MVEGFKNANYFYYSALRETLVDLFSITCATMCVIDDSGMQWYYINLSSISHIVAQVKV